MTDLVIDLASLVAEELHELSWHRGYPIRPNLGISAFLETFSKKGFDVEVDEEARVAKFHTLEKFDGVVKSYLCQMSFDQILRGWGWSVTNSPKSLYDSICEVYDKMERGEKTPEEWSRHVCNRDVLEERGAWSNRRDGESREVRKEMEEKLMVGFKKHHEGMLLSAPGTGNRPLGRPRIIGRVLRAFPFQKFFEIINNRRELAGLDILEFDVERDMGDITTRAYQEDYQSRLLSENFWLDREALLKRFSREELGDLDPSMYFHSESSLVQLFLGIYLGMLGQERGYPGITGNRLREVVVRGYDGLEDGSKIWGTPRLKAIGMSS